jgi:pyruvate formate lyase activating enzyme
MLPKSSEELLVSHIERFATHDGPGIRTTIFLKGCPLRCPWCANPETQPTGPVLMHKAEACGGCGMCREACRTGAISIGPDGTWRHDPAKCVECGRCVWACLQEALELKGTVRSVGELVALCGRDRAYYEESGGGVTVSGGEPLMQVDAVCGLFDALHADGMTCAVETCLQGSREALERVVARTDHVLCDCKHVDADVLHAVTGADARVVSGNLEWLAAHAPERTSVRVPVIPGFNYDDETLRKIVDYLVGLGFQSIDLLPYHTFALGKYEKLGRAYTYPRESLPEEALEPYRDYALSRGVACKIGA